tara:strand:- start:143 stop:2239 length:2097 start_codon:yes stop_codon:yes gene_type:complete
MSLTLSEAFTTKTIIKENWLVKLGYNNEQQGDYYGISFHDTTVIDEDDVIKDYVGCILNKPTLRESINLEDSTAKTSNVSLTIANFMDETGNHFSKQLLGGSTNYINRSVKIYIQPNDEYNINQSVLIYTGRLSSVSHDEKKINLSVVTRRVWDNIMIPNQDDRTTNNIYKPVTYGNYVDVGTNIGNYQNFKAHPIKYCTEIDREQFYLTGQGSNGNKGALFWDKYLQLFSEIDSSSATTGTTLGEKSLSFPINSTKSTKFYFSSVSTSNPASSSEWQDTDELFGGTSYAHVPAPTSFVSDNPRKLYLNCPNIDGEATSLQLKFQTHYDGVLGNSSGANLHLFWEDETGNNLDALHFESFHSYETQVYNLDLMPKYNAKNKTMPEYLNFEFRFSGVGSFVNENVRLFNPRIEVTYAYPNDATRKLDNKAQDFLYSGGDGQVSTTDSSAITEIHEAYLDILRRYTSYSGTPTNYSSGTNLNGSRDWKIRYWILEPTPLIDVLEKLQYEGGFIGRFDGQNTFKMIYIPDSPSPSTTLYSTDISDINISLTDLSSLTTKMDIEYQKHPAENRYDVAVTSTNSTSRTNYKIETAENIKSIKLDAYISPTINTAPSNTSTKNDCFYRYYDHILGSPKLIIDFTVVNHSYYGLDVGDIIEIDLNVVVRPFGGSDWVGEEGDGYVFMITDISRTIGKLKIKAREV